VLITNDAPHLRALLCVMTYPRLFPEIMAEILLFTQKKKLHALMKNARTNPKNKMIFHVKKNRYGFNAPSKYNYKSWTCKIMF
jgi:hypothetical protein